LRGATILSCRLQELIQLIDAGSGGRQNGHEDGASGVGDVITVGARYLLDQSMCPEKAELSADGGGAPPAIRRRLGFGGVQRFLKVAIAEAVDQKITLIDRREEFLVLGPRT
jgi:hypothetical protein